MRIIMIRMRFCESMIRKSANNTNYVINILQINFQNQVKFSRIFQTRISHFITLLGIIRYIYFEEIYPDFDVPKKFLTVKTLLYE